ncbi:MAG: hypothetical protein ACYC96_10320 [Fimbriimonadaceae bacterium]
MFIRVGFLVACVFATQAVLTGCGSNDVVKEDPIVAKKRMDAATSLRSYFDKSGGNFDALSDDDKKAVIALTNNKESDARKAFSMMVLGKPSTPGGAPPVDPTAHNGPEGAKVGH